MSEWRKVRSKRTRPLALGGPGRAAITKESSPLQNANPRGTLVLRAAADQPGNVYRRLQGPRSFLVVANYKGSWMTTGLVIEGPSLPHAPLRSVESDAMAYNSAESTA
jgi:hypothetical protein